MPWLQTQICPERKSVQKGDMASEGNLVLKVFSNIKNMAERLRKEVKIFNKLIVLRYKN